MILDAIIGLFGSLISMVTGIFVPVVNLAAIAIEGVVGIFISGFSLGRMDRKEDGRLSAGSVFGSLTVALAIFAGIVLIPKVMNREVTFVAEDGHSLPFAAMIIHTDEGKRHKRTDHAGNLLIPRFSTRAITVKDPRYIGKTWNSSEIESELIVGRTLLGSGLDSLGERLLRRAKQ